MPWIARLDDNKVVPEEVDDGVDVICPECESEMFPRGPTDDGRARHFAHKSFGKSSGGSGCGGGESPTHKKWKSFTKSRLKQIFEDEFYKSIRLEKTLPLMDNESVAQELVESRSEKSSRDADVLIKFREPHSKYGFGIAIEVQYRNESKDRQATEADYLSQGYSTLWLEESDFGEDRCLIDLKTIRERAISVFPNSIPTESEWRNVERDMANVVSRYKRAVPKLQPVIANQELADPGEVLTSRPSKSADVQLPIEWYRNVAKRFYRDTPWNQLFRRRTGDSWSAPFRTPPQDKEINIEFNLTELLDSSNQALFLYHLQHRPEDLWHIGLISRGECEHQLRHPGMDGPRINADDFEIWINNRDKVHTSWNGGSILIPPNMWSDLSEAVEQPEDDNQVAEKTDGGSVSDTTSPNQTRNHEPTRSRQIPKRIDPKQYEGFDTNSAREGMVKMFDKSVYRWVEIPLEKVPRKYKRRRGH